MTRRFWAPGRINLIGEHTDYTGGLVLPAAITLGIELRGAPADRLELRSDGHAQPVDLPADGGPDAVAGWARYVRAVAAELARLGRPPVGFRGRVTSTLPAGVGLSSSAALEVAVALALNGVAGLTLDATALVLAAQRAEHAAVGVPCGVMDQAASLLGRAGHALLLDTASLEHRYVPLPADLALVIIDSGVRRRLEDSAYAQRRAEVEAAVALLGDRRPRDVTARQAEAILDDAGAGEVLQRRLRHIVTENARVRLVAELLERAPQDRAGLGELLREGHESLRTDLEVSTPELDLLVDLAYADGAVGARMMGGGFGGAVLVLAERDVAGACARRIGERYGAETGIAATSYITAAADGARELPRAPH